MQKAERRDIGYHEGEAERNNVITFVEEHIRRFPDRVALRWVDGAALKAWDGSTEQPLPTREVTYKQFRDLIAHTAAGLLRLGLGKGDRVIIFLPMGLGMYTAMFATQWIGAVAVFLDSWARRSHLGASAECVQPKAMISHQAAFDLVREVPEFAGMSLRIIAGPGDDARYSARLEALMQTPEEPPVAAVGAHHTALITFTTGSSGKPKGANRTHQFLAAQHHALSQVIPYEPADSDLPAFPIFSLNNLATGVTTVLPALDLAAPSERDSAALACQIIHDRIRCTTLSPSMLVNLARYAIERRLELPSLRRVVTGGAPISKDNVRDFGTVAPHAEIWVLYGSTEVEPMAHIEAKEMLALEGDPDPEIVEEGVNVGHIGDDLAYKFIRIVDGPIDLRRTPWSDLEVAAGEVGEFVVTGDHVCRDYYNNDEAFAQTKIQEPEGRVWHRTGDLARMDEQGYLWVVGRVHNVIVRNQRYYFPVRAEVILKRLPFVKKGAFLGIPTHGLGERTAVAVVLDKDKATEQEAVRETQRLFEKNKIPIDSYYFVADIPMDPRHHSKVEYGMLRQAILEAAQRDWTAVSF